MRQIEVSIDTFAELWSQRQPDEQSEDQMIRRLLGMSEAAAQAEKYEEETSMNAFERPPSKKWTELLIWSLQKLGGKAPLSEIYRVSREGRRALGYSTTRHHDDSARECLESHCSESKKWRGRGDLFYMPEGKGSGIWALR